MAGPRELRHPSEDPSMELIYCCRKCRIPLFRPSQLTDHEVGRHHFSFRRTAKDIAAYDGDAARAGHTRPSAEVHEEGAEVEADSSSSASSKCTSFFLAEALQWMKDASTEVEGKLTCPKPRCGARVGSLKWAGSQCSCGTWVTPAVQLYKSACDERYFPKPAEPPPPPPSAAPAPAAAGGGGASGPQKGKKGKGPRPAAGGASAAAAAAAPTVSDAPQPSASS